MRIQKHHPIAKRQQQNLSGGLEKQRHSVFRGREKSADKIVDADGEEQQDGRFGDHVPGVPGEGNPASQGPQVRQGQEHFADQHAAEVAVDSENGNAGDHEAKPQEHGGNALQKGGAGTAKAV